MKAWIDCWIGTTLQPHHQEPTLNWEYCWLWDAAHAWDAGEKPKETSTPAFSFSSFLEAWGPGLTFHLTSNPSPTSHNCGDRKRKVQATTWLSREWTKNQTQQGCCIYAINTYTVYIYMVCTYQDITVYCCIQSLFLLSNASGPSQRWLAPQYLQYPTINYFSGGVVAMNWIGREAGVSFRWKLEKLQIWICNLRINKLTS